MHIIISEIHFSTNPSFLMISSTKIHSTLSYALLISNLIAIWPVRPLLFKLIECIKNDYVNTFGGIYLLLSLYLCIFHFTYLFVIFLFFPLLSLPNTSHHLSSFFCTIPSILYPPPSSPALLSSTQPSSLSLSLSCRTNHVTINMRPITTQIIRLISDQVIKPTNDNYIKVIRF